MTKMSYSFTKRRKNPSFHNQKIQLKNSRRKKVLYLRIVGCHRQTFVIAHEFLSSHEKRRRLRFPPTLIMPIKSFPATPLHIIKLPKSMKPTTELAPPQMLQNNLKSNPFVVIAIRTNGQG